jgi:Ca-activated chloride channel family protein
LSLAVAVRLDSAVFRSSGDFALDLVPADQVGNTFVTEPWAITSALTAPSSVALRFLSQVTEPADSLPVMVAILIDDSGSMRSSDPDRHRATAAQLFWNDVLAGRPGNAVGLLDFGRGDVPPSAGFQHVRLLASLTTDSGTLDAALDQIEAQPGGGTPLYAAANEAVTWIDSIAATPSQRVLVIITDGAPSDVTLADSLFRNSADRGLRIFAVGLGEATVQDPPTIATQVVKELAARTGGIYAAADPPTEVGPVLQRLARSANPARLLAFLRITPVPEAGTKVTGTVRVSGARGTASAPWSFVAP